MIGTNHDKMRNVDDRNQSILTDPVDDNGSSTSGRELQFQIAERQRAEARYRSIFENSIAGIFQSSADGSYLAVNPALARIYGYASADALQNSLTNIAQQLYVQPGRRAEFIKILEQKDSVVDFESQVYRRDGTVIWISEHTRAVRDETGRLLYYEGMVDDITTRKMLEEERERLLQQTEVLLAEAITRADVCPLTGLLNHRAFHKRLEQEADRTARGEGALAVALMDLDNFKFFNDAYGHIAGDEVLRQVASALESCCRTYDVLARFGGDEFAMVLPGMDAAKAQRMVLRLRRAIERVGFTPPGHNGQIPLSLSIGIAVFPTEAPTRVDALQLADERLLRAKTGGSDDGEVERLRASIASEFEGFGMLDALVTAVDNKDRYTRRHSEDVMTNSRTIAVELGLDEGSRKILAVAALLHDVGKIGVPDHILRKPGKLTEEEFAAIKQHPSLGSILVGSVPGFSDILDGVRHHHERWDGFGYPGNLKGKDTPLQARILAVADAYSAMTTDRPYRKGMGRETAISILSSGAGAQWDPTCVRAFVSAMKLRSSDVAV
jgi:diguanylate cyclase (GGDEF)-like protein/PAS domain S-box-containing protein